MNSLRAGWGQRQGNLTFDQVDLRWNRFLILTVLHFLGLEITQKHPRIISYPKGRAQTAGEEREVDSR